MSKRALVAFILASSTLVAPLPMIATSATAVQCSDETPEAMKRPGGFCDIRTKTDTLAPPVSSSPAAQPAPAVDPCNVGALAKSFRWLPRGARILTAGC